MSKSIALALLLQMKTFLEKERGHQLLEHLGVSCNICVRRDLSLFPFISLFYFSFLFSFL